MSRFHRPPVKSVCLAFVLILGLAGSASGASGSPEGTGGGPLVVRPHAAPAGSAIASLAGLSPLHQDEDASPVSRWWNRLYAAAYYDTRWDTWFLHSYYQRGYHPWSDRRFSLYGIAMLSADSRSSDGFAPVLISDNILLFGAGIRFRPADWIWFDAQEGLAFDLVDRGGSDVRGDFRLTATGGTGIYPDFMVHPEFQSPLTALADFYFSSGYYSRYDNWITYLMGRAGARVAEVSRMFADAYLRADMALDARGDFYNNYFEIGPGVRFTPDPDWGLFFLVEYRRGYYAAYTDEMRAERATAYPAQYDAVRFFIVLDREF